MIMKKKTMKAMLKKSKSITRPQITAQLTFSNGRILNVPVYADDQEAIDHLKQQLRDKDGNFTDVQGRDYDLRSLVHYEFLD